MIARLRAITSSISFGSNLARLAMLSRIVRIGVLVVAALLEGFARQLVQDLGLRLAVGWGAGALWLAWILAAGRRAA